MKTYLMWFVSASTCLVQAQEISLQKLSAPYYDGAGHMIRKLTAESAYGPLDLPKLRDGRVEFFPEDKAAEKFATFTFDEAVYQKQAEVVSGDGRASLQSVKGTLSGVGFNYQLTDNHLQLHSHVVGLIGSARIEGPRGEAYFSQISPGKEWMIAKAVVEGGVVVTGIDTHKYTFDRAESPSGMYTGIDGILILESPVTCWRGDEKVVANGKEMKIYLAGNPIEPKN